MSGLTPALTSLGLADWRRSTHDDFDDDGIPDVALYLFDGYDDAWSNQLVLVTSGSRRVDIIQIAATDIFDAETCFVPSRSGPTIYALVREWSRRSRSPRRIPRRSATSCTDSIHL